MSRAWKEVKYWAQLLLLPVYWITYLVPRDKNIWVFGSTFGKRFADNPRYFYLYITQYQSNLIRAIWISKNKEVIRLLQDNKCEAYYLYSINGIWYSLRAKAYFYDNYSKDICFTLSGGARKLNLWHGIPLKKIQKDNIHDKFRNPSNLLERIYGIPRRISDEKPSDYVLATSEKLKSIFTSAFRTERVLISGYPRNDTITSDTIKNIFTPIEREALNEINQKECRASVSQEVKIILYMPTFRDSESKLFDIVDFELLQRVLHKNNMILCIKLHPKSKVRKEIGALNYENIIVIDADSDPYVFLGQADVLITDYSSIYFDYLLLNRPIIFFSYDREEYLKDSREMYYDYLDVTPGVKVETLEELIGALSTLKHNIDDDEMKNKRLEIRNKMFDYSDELSGRRLFETIYQDVL